MLNRRGILQSGSASVVLTAFSITVKAEDWGSPEAKRPPYVIALETYYGPPSQSGYGSTVLFTSPVEDRRALERLAKASYRFFVGALWDKWGEQAWMGRWRLLYERSGAGNIADELRQLSDPAARASGDMLLNSISDSKEAQESLALAFDNADVQDLLVFDLGDGGAMSGVLIAARRQNRDAVFLVFLMD